MRIVKAVLLVIVAASAIFPAKKRPPSAQELYSQHRWFELRDSIRRGAAPDLYQGAVDAAFNRPDEAEKELRAVIQAEPGSSQAHEAHELLRYMFLREGRYAAALTEVDALLRENPNDSDARDDRQIFQVFSHYGDQSLSGSYFSTPIHHGHLIVPLKVNGVDARFALDSGANLSIVSESEARRLRLVVHQVSGKLGDSTGGNTGFQVAIAQQLTMGGAQLKNVAFLVVSDKQQPFADVPPGEKGLVGLPVILALKTLRWSPDGMLEMGFPSPQRTRSRRPNLCFEGAQPILEARLQGRPLAMALDTGAEKTVLWPHFLHGFPAIAQHGRKQRIHKSGVARSLDLQALVVPRLSMRIAGRATLLSPANILLNEVGGASEWFDGNLGLDVLNRARSITLDFRSMTLTMQ
jgi:tetratricopeptide (TPR) repeat protein